MRARLSPHDSLNAETRAGDLASDGDVDLTDLTGLVAVYGASC
jgi:hypothetical protein